MPGRKQQRSPTLPRLPLDAASSKDVKAWQEEAWQKVADEVHERYGDFVVSAALNALNTGQGEREFQRAMRALLNGDRDEFEEFRRLLLTWLEPHINEALGRQWRGQAPWFDVATTRRSK